MSSSQFRRVQSEGKKLYAKHFLVLVAQGTSDRSRVGITITTKIDKRAVVRNRLKRRLREIFRLNQQRLTAPFDIVIIARQNAPSCEYGDICHEVLGSLARSGYLQNDTSS